MSYTFNGTSSKLVNLDNTPVPADTSHTMFAWIKADDASVTSSDYIVFLGNDSSAADYNWLSIVTNDALAGSNDGTNASIDTASNPLRTGEWCAVAAMFTASGSGGVISDRTSWAYDLSNGQATSSTESTSKTLSPWPTDVAVGVRNTGTASAYFPGKIAHVAIWNRVLTSGELTTLATSVPSAVSSGLIHYWPLTADLSDSIGGATYLLTATDSSLDGADNPTLSTGASAVAGISRHYARMMNG